jgi:hypothetical protein
LALRSPANPRQMSSIAGSKQIAKRARLVQGLSKIFFIHLNLIDP